MRKKHLKSCINYFIIAILSVVLYSCSTQKDKFLNRNYHKATSKFNGYFNGKESLKEAIAKLEKSYQEDYNNLLPTTILGDQKQAQKIYPQLNRTIDKAGLIIERHSMEIKGDEKNKWIDDSYFLIGKALFYKQEYTEALEMFAYINREYEGYITDLSILWSARAQIELENFTTAEQQMLYLDREVKLKKSDYALFLEINANYHIKQKNWREVITYLAKTIKYSRDKKKRVRLTYIIGQIYHQLEDYKSAYNAFDKVVRMNPEYEFLFNALLSRARAFDPKHNNSSKLINEINKMLKDDKNIDYKDQIYFALAEIALKEEQKDLAIDHLLDATANNSGNDQQQSIAHLTLAEIYFNDAAYLSAQVHYDTAITFLSENHPDFDAVSKKRESLNELVDLYNTITLNDSLYSLSELDEDELKTIIDEIIEEKKEEERLAKEALRANAGSRSNTNSRNQFNPLSGGGGKWYFYNPSAISFGYSEFITKWGERRLEDDWRRKNKKQIFLDEEEDGEEKDIYSQEYYMDLIPFTDSAKSATTDLIVECFYQLGLIYKEELKDFNEAVNTLETLIEAYPKNKYEALSYYQLYTLYKLLNDDSSAEEYVQKLKQEHPDCEYLKMIFDPEGYYSENKELIDSAFVYYEEIYAAFSNHEYEYVLAQNSVLEFKYEGHPVADQLSLLSALSIGHMFGEDTLKVKLDELINTYYSGEVVDEAREILQGLENKSVEPEETRFELDLNEKHYYVLALEGGRTNINKTKIAVSDFNRKFYNINEYKTQSLMLNIDYQLIIVKPFENGNTALKYLEAIKNAEALKELLGTSDYEHFIISSSNFKAFYKDKSLDKYVVYFEGTYLKQK
ncbi:MAG: tetratricopeptide repeat protein [Flavobacteriales bacterium]|nr:tetratricopeptide repeat protein [Flavobacteriales bacterium]